MSPEGASGQIDTLWFGFHAAGAAQLLSLSLYFPPKWPWPILSHFLTHKSIWRKVPGHHASDVPLVISLGLIAYLEKLKKKGEKREKVGSGALEVGPSHHQHTEHILCFGLIQLDIHSSFSCFQASLINFVVNSRASSCYSFLSCVRRGSLAPPLCTLSCFMVNLSSD